MPDIKAKVATAKVDPWETPKETWEYITIPKETALGDPHDDLSINQRKFEAGKKYLVPKEVAEFLTERLFIYNKECVRRLQPTRDYASERAVSYGSAIAAQPIDASTIG